jgi:G protein-coupled receptor GPR1
VTIAAAHKRLVQANNWHRLIMLLVFGDVTRSIWYFVFSIYVIARGNIESESKLCQASGFFIQYGTEISGK